MASSTSTRASTLTHEAAVEATCLWLQCDHESCFQTLQRLELDHTLDDDCPLQVQHNLAIVDHYSNQRRDPARLLDQLTLLLKEAVSKVHEAPAPVSSRGAQAPAAAAPPEAAAAGTDESTANLRLNKALLLYRGLQYDEATQLLTPLLQHVDGLDEGTALHVLLLLLDMHLHQHDARQAAHVLSILDKACPSLTSSFSSASQQQQQSAAVPAAPPVQPSPSPPPAATIRLPTSAPASHMLPFVSNWGSCAMVEACHLLTQRGHPIPASPNIPLLLKLYRIRLALLQQNLRAAKRELRAMLALDPACPASAGPALGPGSLAAAGPSGTPLPDRDAVAQLQAADASGAPTTISLEAGPEPPSSSGSSSVHAMASASNLGAGSGAGPPASCASALAKAHVEVMRGSGRKAALILGGMLQSSSEAATISSGEPGSGALQAVLLNNLGVVLHYGGQHQLSALHFKQAMHELPPPGQREGQGADGGGASCSGRLEAEAPPSTYEEFAVLYNAGLQYAALGKHKAALSCFSRCVSASQHASGLAAHRPLLLLRAAQAALGLHQASLPADSHGPSIPWVTSASQPASTPASGPRLAAIDPLHGPPGDQSQALLQQALGWLQTARQLLEPEQQQPDCGLAAGSAGTSPHTLLLANPEDLLAAGAPSGSHTAAEQHRTQVLPAILTCLAYVKLLLGDYDAALAASMQLLSMPSAAPDQVQAAACYAAEVLKALGRDGEAVRVIVQAQSAWAAAMASAGCVSGSHPLEEDSHGEAAPSMQAGEGAGGAEAVAPPPPSGEHRTEAERAGRAALCTNLSLMLVSQPQLAAAVESEAAGGEGGSGAAPSQLVSEALELQPGCRPTSLLATYLDMTSGRCHDALERIRAMQL